MEWCIGKRIKFRAQSRAEVIRNRKGLESSSPTARSPAPTEHRRTKKAWDEDIIEFVGSMDKSGKFTPFVVESETETNKDSPPGVQSVPDTDSWKSGLDNIVLIESDDDQPEKCHVESGLGGEEGLGIDLGVFGSSSEDDLSEDDEDDKDYNILGSDHSLENPISSPSSSDDDDDDHEDGELFDETIGDTDDGGFKKGKKARPNEDSPVSSKTVETEVKKGSPMKRKRLGEKKQLGTRARKPRKYEKGLTQKKTQGMVAEEEGKITEPGDRNGEKEREQQKEMAFSCPNCCKMSKGVSEFDKSFTRPPAESEKPVDEPELEQQHLKQVPPNQRDRAEDSVSNSLETRFRKPSADEGEKAKEAEAEAEAEVKKSSGWRVLGGRKELDVFGLLVNSIWGEKRVEEDDPAPVASPPEEEAEEQENNDEEYDEDGLLVIKPPPLILDFGWPEPEPPVISESQKEEEKLWEEMAFCLRLIEMGSEVSSDIGKKEESEESTVDENQATLCLEGKHELCLALKIGIKCICCGFIGTEIRHVDVSEWAGKKKNKRNKTERSEENDKPLFEKLGFQAPYKNGSAGSHYSEETVWDVIPGTKTSMYPHQQEGFEFIWRNLAGTIFLNELKSFETSDETGGCIISHAPGTGKTRLTIVFLQSYMELYPDCRPVIIAPASLLLTWEEEFKKWGTNVPFHNLNNLELSGKESSKAVKIMGERGLRSDMKDETRMVKLFSWSRSKSVLGISYNLYEKLAGEKIGMGKKRKADGKPDKKREEYQKILIEMPGLLVLDEAHTPRNQRSCIWKTLLKVRTQKRILLSGTPFQNNFLELRNVLCLARPAYLGMLSSMLKKRKMKNGTRKRGSYASSIVSTDEINNDGIEELKGLMEPFVHVHKGSILQKSLPGLRDCVVVLKPPDLQKKVLEVIGISKCLFDAEHKLSLVSIHPSLLTCCSLSNKEQSALGQSLLEQLRKMRLEPIESVKMRFLIELIQLCDVINEKVLVFSQFIDPLSLIMEQLGSLFNWLEGKEVLYMHGKLDQKQRQCLINKFNDPKSEAKLILASTKACSEGINLVGASRVVLLDVVWNPSVERQAISRAYRIGQKRIVYTYHLVTKGTPECQKYCKQAEKHRISELVFSSGNEKGKQNSEAMVTEDKVMEEMVQHVKLQDMFEKLIYQPKEADLVEGFNSIAP